MSKNEVEKQLALEKLQGQVDSLVKEADHGELFGEDLKNAEKDVQETLLTKFLQANNHDVAAAKDQLLKTLKWRKKFSPLSAAFKEKHKEVYDELGLVTKHESTVMTWNLYGAVEDKESVFGDLDSFLRWRVGLMELGISKLDFSDASKSKMSQVHDYKGVNFFAMDAKTKTATKNTIQIFQDYYPEMLDKKYFVNVPKIMGWVFTLVKPLVSKETLEKFNVLSDGSKLASNVGDWAPKSYGGKAESLSALRLTEFTPINAQLVEEDADRRTKDGAEKKLDGSSSDENKKEESTFEDKKVEESSTNKKEEKPSSEKPNINEDNEKQPEKEPEAGEAKEEAKPSTPTEESKDTPQGK
ncbi:hypothetical protein TRICI_006530 [Trichomonascus ciferrii]|uniref:Phosphatidylinositol transfer protein SFH5 n=1 Tax=Trichomonascus ciferrii TaxID=44093 RepID=A0A6A1LNN6_9ASCO|nr:hypothetical protein TRICI_006530 [Trichomonascus ciferrii]